MNLKYVAVICADQLFVADKSDLKLFIVKETWTTIWKPLQSQSVANAGFVNNSVGSWTAFVLMWWFLAS